MSVCLENFCTTDYEYCLLLLFGCCFCSNFEKVFRWECDFLHFGREWDQWITPKIHKFEYFSKVSSQLILRWQRTIELASEKMYKSGARSSGTNGLPQNLGGHNYLSQSPSVSDRCVCRCAGTFNHREIWRLGRWWGMRFWHYYDHQTKKNRNMQIQPVLISNWFYSSIYLSNQK